MLIAFVSDKLKHRFAFMMIPILVCIAGFAILLAVHDNTRLEYAALFLVTMGAYSALPIAVCWYQQNLGGHRRRAIGSAWQIGFGNTGGIIAVFVFLMKDAPKYITGYSVCIAFSAVSLVAGVVYLWVIMAQNARRSHLPALLTDAMLEEEYEQGDMASHYRYML